MKRFRWHEPGSADAAGQEAAPVRGPAILIVALYGLFALSASGRALFQVFTKFDDAPLAFTLSAFAAGLYGLITFALASSRAGAAQIARIALWVELVGVLVVGGLSFSRTDWFPEPTVWSHFGQGYGFLPLVLPVLGLWWVAKRSSQKES